MVRRDELTDEQWALIEPCFRSRVRASEGVLLAIRARS